MFPAPQQIQKSERWLGTPENLIGLAAHEIEEAEESWEVEDDQPASARTRLPSSSTTRSDKGTGKEMMHHGTKKGKARPQQLIQRRITQKGKERKDSGQPMLKQRRGVELNHILLKQKELEQQALIRVQDQGLGEQKGKGRMMISRMCHFS